MLTCQTKGRDLMFAARKRKRRVVVQELVRIEGGLRLLSKELRVVVVDIFCWRLRGM